MNTLHNMSVLNTVARTVSDKVGRPWIEATYNGIRLGPNQLPNVWKLRCSLRLLGVPYMPDVYVSGDSMWNTYTFGSDKSSFIVLGTPSSPISIMTTCSRAGSRDGTLPRRPCPLKR